MKKLLAVLSAAVLATACAPQSSATSPTPSASASATPSPSASASPSPSTDRAVVYVARDRLPPAANRLKGAGDGATAKDRIYSRLDGLWAIGAASGQTNVVRSSKAKLASVAVQGDTATVDFTVANDDWGVNGSSTIKGFVQQVIYTASEEAGIRKVLITQNGGKRAVIGGEGLVIDGPRTREDVAGYAVKASTESVSSGGDTVDATPLFSYTNEEIAPALVRASIELRRTTGTGAWVPAFTASVAANDEYANPDRGKWIVTIEVPGVQTKPHADAIEAKYRPLRWLAATNTANGVRYELGFDELRPWRAAVLQDPTRIVFDLGGDPDATAANNAVYAPRVNGSVLPNFTISGVARFFEATVSWRVQAGAATVAKGTTMATLGTNAVFGAYEIPVIAAGVHGKAVVEVFQTSAKDGSEIDLVRVPVTLP